MDQERLSQKVKDLQAALDRLIRFNRALIHMNAVETPQSLDVECTIAWHVLFASRD